MGAPQYEQAGADIGGTGTTNTIPRWTGASTLGDSGLTDDGTTITAANRALSWTRTSGLVGTFNRQDGNEAIFALATSGAVRGYVGAGASKAFNVFNAAATSELVTVLNGGNVGIGTTSPSYKLDVVGAPNAVGAAISTTYGTATTVYSAFRFNNTGLAYGNSEIRNYVDGSTSLGSNLALFTSQVGTGTLTERVRIDSNGNVGIGTASPNAILSVYNAGTPTISLWNSSNYSRLATNTNDLYIDAGLGGAAGAVIFRRGSGTVDSARIDSNGNIYGTSGTTGMTNGFFYIPAAAGAPTGVPTAVAGRVPMYYDTTNNQFYVYNGAWKKVTLA